MGALLLYGHLLGVMILLVGTGGYLAGTEGLRAGRTLDQIRLAAVIAAFGTRLLVPGGLLLLGFGLTLAARSWSFSDPWIATSIGLVGVLGANGLRSERWLREVTRALRGAGDGPIPPRLAALTRLPVHHAADRSILAVLAELEFLMTVKPDLGPLLISLLVAGAAAGTLALTAVRSSARTAGSSP